MHCILSVARCNERNVRAHAKQARDNIIFCILGLALEANLKRPWLYFHFIKSFTGQIDV